MGITPLTASRHGNIRIGARPDPVYGARHNHAVLGASEIMYASADFPLLLMKDGETGAFNIVALFGFAPGQNRYVINGRWQATWLPGAMLRYPFYRDENAPHGLAIDEECGLLHAARGEALFADGQPTSFTNHIAETIAALVDDIAAAQALAKTLAASALVRPLTLLLIDASGHENQIDGLYGISLQALDELDDRTVLSLHRQGALRAGNIIAGSLGQLERVRQLHEHASGQPISSMAYTIAD